MDEQVVDGGLIKIGAGTEKTDPLNPNTLEKQIGPTKPSKEQSDSSILERIEKYISKGIILTENEERGIYRPMSLIYFAESQDAEPEPAAFIRQGLIDINRTPLDYSRRFIRDWSKTSDRFQGVVISLTTDIKKIKDAIEKIDPDYKELEEDIYDSCMVDKDRTGNPTIDYDILKKHVPEISYLVNLDGAQGIAKNHPYFTAIMVDKKFRDIITRSIDSFLLPNTHQTIKKFEHGVDDAGLNWDKHIYFGRLETKHLIKSRREYIKETGNKLSLKELIEAYDKTNPEE